MGFDDKYISKADDGRYRVRIKRNGKRESVGHFDTLDEARAARDKALGVRIHDEAGASERARTHAQTIKHSLHLSSGNVIVPSVPVITSGATWQNDAFPGAAQALAGMGPALSAITYGGAVSYQGSPTVNTLPPVDTINVPANAALIAEKPITATLDRWLYASDFHAPLHSRTYVRRLIQVARARKVRDIVIGGDLSDLDSISRHGRAEAQAGYKVTRDTTGELLYLLAQECNLWVLPGNHDDRLRKRLDDDVPFVDFVHAALAGRTTRNKIAVTDYSYIFVQGPRRKWVVGHPTFYSSTPAKGVADVAQLHQMSVIGAHNHLQGLMWSKDGRHIAIDPGCMCDGNLTPYMKRHAGMSKYGTWVNGFVLVDNDVPTIMGDGLVEWGQYGAE